LKEPPLPEAVQLTYDPSKVTYSELLQVFWRQIDPTDPDGQFVDRGSQYRSFIFYHNEGQKRLAEDLKSRLLQKLSKPRLFIKLKNITRITTKIP
jgi:methionine-S-sulfoxide reductase